MADHYMKVGDRLPKIKATLRNPDGTVTNLTGATVQFRMRSVKAAAAADAPKVLASATVVDPTGGIVEYAWGASDCDTEGDFRGEWIVTFGSSTQTHPNDTYSIISVKARA